MSAAEQAATWHDLARRAHRAGFVRFDAHGVLVLVWPGPGEGPEALPASGPPPVPEPLPGMPVRV